MTMVLTANIKIRISKRKKKCIMTKILTANIKIRISKRKKTYHDNDTNSKFKEVIYSLMQCIMTKILTANIKIRISKRKKKCIMTKELKANIKIKKSKRNAFSSIPSAPRMPPQEPSKNDPGKSSVGVFEECNQLNNVCVTKSYKSNSFCGISYLCNCSEEVIPLNDCRDDIFYCDINLFTVNSTNAIEWEKQTNGCLRYECSDDGEFKIQGRCGPDQICMNDECIDESTEWGIELDIEPINSNELNVTEIISIISQISNIESNKMTVSTKIDNHGKVYKIIVHVSDENTSLSIIETVNDCISLKSSEDCKKLSDLVIQAIHIAKSIQIESSYHPYLSKFISSFLILTVFIVLC